MDDGSKPAGESFAGLFCRHWDAGTGLKRSARGVGRSWTAKEFADAMKVADCAISVDAIGNWIKGTNLPRRPQMLAILDIFFPVPVDGCSPQHADRDIMYAVWTDLQRPRAKRTRAPVIAEPSPESAADWPRDNPQPLVGLAELELHTPHADNEGGHRLRGRLVVGAREDDSNDKPILLTMREAFLRLESSIGIETDGSLIGIREAHEHLVQAPGGLRVVGPQSITQMPDGSSLRYLDGEVFDGKHIAILKDTNENNEDIEVQLTLSVMRRSFDVVPLDGEGRPLFDGITSEAKQSILNLIIFERLPRDEQGRVIVQKAKLRRRPKA